MKKFNRKKKKQNQKRLIEILQSLVFYIIFMFFFNQIVNYLSLSDKETPSIKVKAKQGGTDTCVGRYVYVHDLPSRFNDDLMKNCEAYIELRNKCKFFVNSGYGPEILEDDHNQTGQILIMNRSNFGLDPKKACKSFGPGMRMETGSWYSTNQFMLEVIFREKMRYYDCLTNDSSLSSAVFVPFYAGFDARRFWGYNVKIRDELGEDLARWLRERPEWMKMYGRDHFFVAGRVGRDFKRVSDEDSDWGNKLALLPEFQNMTMLSIETNSQTNEFGVPYPTHFHPKTETEVNTWQRHIRTIQRRYLFSFIGASRPDIKESIRSEIIRQCIASQGSCKFRDCEVKDCDNPVKVIEIFQNSVFCLQPPGDTPTRRSTFDSILAGCIPVFFNRDSAYSQYKWYFPEDHTKYSVYISEDDVKNGKVNIEKLLVSVGEETILRMRNEIENIIPKIIYTKPGAVGPDKIEDAFEIAVSRVIERVSLFKMQVSED